MDVTGNFQMKKPNMADQTQTIDDAINAIGYNANIVDQQLKSDIHCKSVNIENDEAVLNFWAKVSDNQARIISYSDSQPSGNLFIEPQNYIVIRSLFSGATNLPVSMSLIGDLHLTGHLIADNGKQRGVNTENYGKRGLNAYETPDCLFADYRRGKLVNGECKIDIDPIFLETVNTKDYPYDVYITKYGQGDIWVDFDSMKEDSFIVKGDNDIYFGYHVVAKQLGFEDIRLNEIEDNIPNNNPNTQNSGE